MDEEEAGYRFVASNGIFRVAVQDGRMVALAELPALRQELGLTEGRVEDVFLGFIARERERARVA